MRLAVVALLAVALAAPPALLAVYAADTVLVYNYSLGAGGIAYPGGIHGYTLNATTGVGYTVSIGRSEEQRGLGGALYTGYNASIWVLVCTKVYFLYVGVKPSGYGGEPQVVGVKVSGGGEPPVVGVKVSGWGELPSAWHVEDALGVDENGYIYTFISDFQGETVDIDYVGLGHSAPGYADPTQVYLAVIAYEPQTNTSSVLDYYTASVGTHVYECNNCYGAAYLDAVPVQWTTFVPQNECTNTTYTYPPPGQPGPGPAPIITPIEGFPGYTGGSLNASGIELPVPGTPYIPGPGLETPEQIIFTALLVAIYIALVSEMGLGPGTLVYGFILSVLGAVSANSYLAVTGIAALVLSSLYMYYRSQTG